MCVVTVVAYVGLMAVVQDRCRSDDCVVRADASTLSLAAAIGLIVCRHGADCWLCPDLTWKALLSVNRLQGHSLGCIHAVLQQRQASWDT